MFVLQSHFSIFEMFAELHNTGKEGRKYERSENKLRWHFFWNVHVFLLLSIEMGDDKNN